MAWVNSEILDGGLLALKNGTTKVLLLNAYTNGATYAAVTAAAIASADVAPADLVIGDDGTSRRCQLVAGKTGTASASTVGGTDLFIAFTNGIDKVLFVCNETSDQAVTAGNPVNFPQSFYRANQPTG